MKRGGIAAWLAVALVAASVLHMAHYYPRLPERVASHFGAGGEPNGWSSKAALLWVYALTVLLTAASFLGVAALIARLPASMISLPNKDVWLAPERREETLRVITGFLAWLGVATLLFLMLTMESVFRANLEASPRLDPAFMAYFGAYMALVVAGTVWLVVRFYRKPEPRSPRRS